VETEETEILKVLIRRFNKLAELIETEANDCLAGDLARQECVDALVE